MDHSNRQTSRESPVVKTKKPRTEQSLQAKRESDRVRNKTRINIGLAFPKWRQLRDLKGFKRDPEMAFFFFLLSNLFICCQAETDHLTDVGQNVTINCDFDGEIYWLLQKYPDPPVMILRTLSNTFLSFNKTFRHKYSVQSHRHLFINNVTTDDLGVYYCMKTDTVPPEFSKGTRLRFIESTLVSCTEQNQTEVKCIHQNQTWQTLILIFALLTGVLIIVVIGLLKVFVVGNKRSGEQHHNVDLQQTQVIEQPQDPNQLQYAEVNFSKLRKKYRSSQVNSTYAALQLPK
ncbi:uncharacterized protein LOC127438202 isoform X4 [Myxocyprinus asiaticus]|uniref:uncharacterized protein LOC127438202 isoform X4 n=1 Tax=Myxocyprinus asiaticus TaxID=70543 RepID=UPI0022228A1A|nr:uncharacterized protein LOC127438202 isoform X4 [Myxocyprinus asiaticus]